MDQTSAIKVSFHGHSSTRCTSFFIYVNRFMIQVHGSVLFAMYDVIRSGKCSSLLQRWRQIATIISDGLQYTNELHTSLIDNWHWIDQCVLEGRGDMLLNVIHSEPMKYRLFNKRTMSNVYLQHDGMAAVKTPQLWLFERGRHTNVTNKC